MSQHSLLNIQEISSRTFHNDHSLMETSIEPIDRNSPAQQNGMVKGGKRIVSNNYQQIIRMQQQEINRYKNALTSYINRIQDMERSKGFNHSYEIQIKELMVMINERDQQVIEIKQKYQNAIMGLQETIEKNELLYKEVERLKKKNNQIELNYSRDQNIFHKSQNLISNLSVTKSNYQIDLVNLQDSLVILQKQNQKIAQTNDQYEQKLALISQEIERLRGVLDQTRKENQKLKLAAKQQIELTKKIEYENLQNKSVLERIRIENRDLKNHNSTLSLQLHEYHEKIVYKQTLINDLQQRESRIAQTLKSKEGQIKQLEGKVDRLQKANKIYQQQSSKKNNEYMQELGKVRIILNETTSSQKKIQIEREQLLREYNQFIVRFQNLKKQHESVKNQKENILIQIVNITRQKQSLLKEKQYLIKQIQAFHQENQHLKESLIISETNFKQNNQQRSRQYEHIIMKLEEKEKYNARQFQERIQALNQQKNKEIDLQIIQINKYRNQINIRENELTKLRMELNNRNVQINQLKQSTISQSTLVDNTRRDYQDKLRQKTQALNQLKIKIQNFEKLIEQNRRERDMIFQQKNTVILQFQKSQQRYQSKNEEIKILNEKLQQIIQEAKSLQKDNQIKNQDIQNYKRVLSDNQSVLRDLGQKLKQSDIRTFNLTNQIERIATILKEKQVVNLQLNTQCKMLFSNLEEKKNQISNLRQANERFTSNLSRVQQSRGNFQLFMKEIERLNQVISGKQLQIKSQRVQIAKVIQKIDVLYQQQLNIVKIIENTYADDAKRGLSINNQLSQIKQFMLKLNQNTNYTLQDIYQQGGAIFKLVNLNQSETKQTVQRLNSQLSQLQTIVSLKQEQNTKLKQELSNLQVKIIQKDQNQAKQSQIFEKLIQLTRQNAAIKEQLNFNKSQFQQEIQVKNTSIIHLQSKINQYQRMQKKEVQELKLYINQKETFYNESNQRLRKQKQQLQIRQKGFYQDKERQLNRIIVEKDKSIEAIRIEKNTLEQKLQNVALINSRLQQLQKNSQVLAVNIKQIQHYKELVRNYQERIKRYQSQKLQNSRINIFQKEIEKLQKIVEIRNIQISSNQQNFFKLKSKLQQTEKDLVKTKALVNEHKKTEQTVVSLRSKLKQLQEERNKNAYKFQELNFIKNKNLQLQKQLRGLQNRLKISQGNLQGANVQVDLLKQQFQKILQSNSRSIHKLSVMQTWQSERQALLERTYQMQDELQFTKGNMRQIQIDYDYLRSNQEQNKMHLHQYQYKTNQLQKQYFKLKQILNNLRNENSKLQTKNYYFEVQLKKAELLQQKIQVINDQINRISCNIHNILKNR